MSSATIAKDSFGVFGTTAVLLVTGHHDIGQARAIADGKLAEIDLACSRFRPDSELSRLNAAAGKPVTVSQTLADLLGAALRAAELTDGSVDPTCGAALAALGYDRDFADVLAGEGSGPSGSAVAPGHTVSARGLAAPTEQPEAAGPVPGW